MAIGDRVVSMGSVLLPAAVVSVAMALAVAPLSLASDKLKAPGTVKGQRTTIMVLPDAETDEYKYQRLEILDNGEVTCRNLRLKGAISAPVVGHVRFGTVAFDSCVYLGQRARLNTSSCEIVITSGGLGTFTSHKGKKCNVRVEVPGCTVYLGKGPFLELGYRSYGSPRETTALTAPVPIGGTAIGSGCLTPGPHAIAQYKGYLRFQGWRNGVQKPFIVIL